MLSNILLIIVGAFIFGVMIYGLGMLIFSKDENSTSSETNAMPRKSRQGKSGAIKMNK